MDRDGFWAVVESSRAPLRTADQVARRAVRLLQRRPPDEILSFGRECDQVAADSSRTLLWAAAYLLNGGSSDDGFDYFRGWLITRGRRSWTRAVADPDSLADAVMTNRLAQLRRALLPLECERMLGAAADAYERATGDPAGYWAALSPPVVPEDVDDWFDFDDPAVMRSRLPRLSKALRV